MRSPWIFGPYDDVFEDRLRKRIGALKDHPDTVADRHRIDVARVDVLAVEQHLAVDARVGREIVHAVERANERRFAAARRADQAMTQCSGTLRLRVS